MQKLHVGTLGWSYNFWRGKFYPEKLSSKMFLSYYAKIFNSVEIEGTFYRIPSVESVLSWKEQTPEDFVFSLKFPQVITHIKMLKDCQEETSVFLDRAKLLGRKLGCLLIQLPPAFKSSNLALLDDFLKDLPREYRYVVEVRNKSLLIGELYSLLRRYNVVLAWVDSPFVPVADEITSDFVYVRWEGDRKKVNGMLGRVEVDRESDVKVWADKIKLLLDRIGVFGYFSKHYSGYPVEDVYRLLRFLGFRRAVSNEMLG